ncbi:MAG: AraC family transcriptional regulator [Pseudomonadota bacterium]
MEQGSETALSLRGKTLNAVRYITVHYAEKLSIATLAAECHLCPDVFVRRFKDEQGMNPCEYIKRYRLDAAKTLLAGSLSNVQEIAYKVGYNDVSQFNRLFRAQEGKTPLAYRYTTQVRSSLDRK